MVDEAGVEPTVCTPRCVADCILAHISKFFIEEDSLQPTELYLRHLHPL